MLARQGCPLALALSWRVLRHVSGDNPGTRVQVHGHTSTSSGSDARNDAVSLARAEAVKKGLLKLGVQEQQIEISSKGSRSPLGKEDGEVSKAAARNRRVEVRFVAPSVSGHPTDIDIGYNREKAAELGKLAEREPIDPHPQGQADVWDYASMVAGIIGDIAKEGSKLSLIGILSPIFDLIGFWGDFSDALTAHRRAAVKLGIRLGLQACETKSCTSFPKRSRVGTSRLLSSSILSLTPTGVGAMNGDGAGVRTRGYYTSASYGPQCGSNCGERYNRARRR